MTSQSRQHSTNTSASTSPSTITFGDPTPWAEPAWSNSLTSPYYNDSHVRLRNTLRSYIDEHIAPHMLDWEAAGVVPREEARRWRASGFSFMEVPERYRPEGFEEVGGKGATGLKAGDLDVFHLLVKVDETARILGGVGVGLEGANGIGVPPITNHGTEAQKQRWLPGLFTLETCFCLGITEPTGGSDVGAIRTTAKKSSDGSAYIVSGNKKWITGAPWATHMTTAVRTGGPGISGISLLVIPLKDTPGVTIRRIANSGQHAGGASWVSLEDVRVPAENLIGKENEGFALVMTNFNKERFIMAVGCNRMARTCLSSALVYAHERETFGKILASHQVIRHKLANVAREVEGHWAWLEQLAYHVQQKGWQSPDLASRMAMVKVKGAQLVELAAREAQQIFGGNGYSRGGVGGDVEQISRDLRMMVVGGGSEEILNDLAYKEELKRARRTGAKL